MSGDESVSKQCVASVVYLSRSLDSMEFASSYNTQPNEPYNGDGSFHSHLQLLRDKNDIRSSMLAYTNYVIQRQRRNNLYNKNSLSKSSANNQRYSSPDINDQLCVKAKNIPHVSNHRILEYKTNQELLEDDYVEEDDNISSKSCKLPSIAQNNKIHNSHEGLKRGNTFPPTLDTTEQFLTIGINPLKEGSSKVNSFKKLPSIKTRKLGVVHTNPKQAWRHDLNEKAQDNEISSPLSVLGKRPPNKHLLHLKKNTYEKAIANVSNELEINLSSRNVRSKKERINKLTYVKQGPSQETLRNAIATLQLMEKQIDTDQSNFTVTNQAETTANISTKPDVVSSSGSINLSETNVISSSGSKSRGNQDAVDSSRNKSFSNLHGQAIMFKLKKGRRLKLPKQELDIIPELDCERSYIKFNTDYNVNNNGHKSPQHLDASEECYNYLSLNDHKSVLKPQVIRKLKSFESSLQKLPKQTYPQDAYELHDYSLYRKDKAKLDLKSKLRKKTTSSKLFYIEQQV